LTTPEQFTVPPVSPVPQRKASGGVVALGVINIIYAILFRFCCGVGSLAFSLAVSSLPALLPAMPDMQGRESAFFDMFQSGPMRAYSVISMLVMLILGIGLLVGGIGLLKLKPWGRSLSLGVAVAEIVWIIFSFAINIFFVYPRAAEMMAEQSPQSSQMAMNVVAGTVGVLFALVYPIVLLVCLNLTSVKEQFQPTAGA
jgi:hypothetical protein